jgi:hypothetical protein
MFSNITYRVITSTVETIDTVGMIDGGEADSINTLRYVE